MGSLPVIERIGFLGLLVMEQAGILFLKNRIVKKAKTVVIWVFMCYDYFHQFAAAFLLHISYQMIMFFHPAYSPEYSQNW